MVVGKLPYHVLKRIALYGGVVALGGAVFFQYKIQVQQVQRGSPVLHRDATLPPALILISNPIRGNDVVSGAKLQQVLLDAAAANFRKQEYYRLSLELLHGYPPAAKLLGEPIVARRVELGDPEKTRTDSLNARLAILLKGCRQNGTLHSWASRNSIQEPWTVDRLDLELENRQWTFYVNPQSPASVTEGAVSQFKDDLEEADGQVSSTTRRKNSIQSQELLYINTKSPGS